MAEAALWPSFAALLAVVTVADIRTRLIPDVALVAATLAGAALLALTAPGMLPGRLGAAGAAGIALLLPALARPGGLGLGDVKLGAVLGLYLGTGVAAALTVAFATGALWGAGLVLVHGWSARTTAIPFAPFLALGAWTVALFA